MQQIDIKSTDGEIPSYEGAEYHKDLWVGSLNFSLEHPSNHPGDLSNRIATP